MFIPSLLRKRLDGGSCRLHDTSDNYFDSLIGDDTEFGYMEGGGLETLALDGCMAASASMVLCEWLVCPVE